MIGTTVSHYAILDTLGSGGMGVVYKATDTRLGRTVALKFLSDDLSRDPLAVERFGREARAASGLNHPTRLLGARHRRARGAPLHRHGVPRRRAARQRIGGRPLPLDQLLELGIQIADALCRGSPAGPRASRHQARQHLRHRSRSRQAARLRAGQGGTAIDAGATAAGTTLEHLTSPGSIVGTVAFMSPEQVRGEPLDARTDIFSLGAVLYEMATGRQAFAGATTGHDS